MRPTTMIRLALAGTRADALRVVLTAVSTTLATITLLSAATVLSIKGVPSIELMQEDYAAQYSNALLRESGLRPGVAFALLLLTIPVFGLAAQCARLGAPERDRRLSGMRLAGASPRQTVLIASAETGVASAIGVALGVVTYLAGRSLAHRPDPVTKRLPLPTDVLPPLWVFVATCLVVPVLAAVFTALALRRVTFGPFGVIRWVRTDTPSPWPAVLIVLGLTTYPIAHTILRHPDWGVSDALVAATLLLGIAAALIGVVFGTGWLTVTAGRLLRRVARRPAALLAGSRLTADPWSTARSYTALLFTVAFGAGTVAISATFDASQRLDEKSNAMQQRLMGSEHIWSAPDPFYDRAFQLVYFAIVAGMVVAAAALMVAVGESIVTRRRSYASLVATGVPRGVLARASLWQTLTPLLFTVPVTITVGAAMPLLVYGRTKSNGFEATACLPPEGVACDNPEIVARYSKTIHVPEITQPLPVPWAELVVMGVGALTAAAVVTAVALLVLRPSTRPSELRIA